MALTPTTSNSETKQQFVKRAYFDDAISQTITGNHNIALNTPALVFAKTIAVIIAATGLDAADSTSQLQGSIDGTNWVDIGAAVTLNASPAITISHSSEPTPWSLFRIEYTAVSVTTGTLAIQVLIKE